MLCALGVAAVMQPPTTGKSPAPFATATASLTEAQPSHAMRIVEVMPVIEVRATRL